MRINGDQFNGFWGQLMAALTQQRPKLTDDDLRFIDGDLNRFNGEVIEKRYGEQRNEVSRWVDRRYARWTGWYQGYEEEKTAS